VGRCEACSGLDGKVYRLIAELAQEEVHGPALHDDGEDDDDVGGGEDPAVGGGRRDSEGEGQAESSAETTPAECGDGAAVLLAERLEGSENQGDHADANREHDDDGDQAGGEVKAVEGDGEHFEAEEDEEQDVLELVDDCPEAVDAFVGDGVLGVAAVELAEGDAGDDGFERGGEMEVFGEGVASEGK